MPTVRSNALSGMIEYLKLMKEYYQTEVRIRNIYQERQAASKDLILVSIQFDREMFEAKGVPLILKLRHLTVKLVYAIKSWKEMVKRATATFTIADASKGQDIGKQLTIQEKNMAKQVIKCLKFSSDLPAQSSLST